MSSIEDLFMSASRVGSVSELDALPRDTDAVHLDVLDDERAAHLTKFVRLKGILHSGTSAISDTGIRQLATIATLEVLDLEWSGAITDTALSDLKRLPRLRWLDLSFCAGLTPQAISDFICQHPNCEVER